MHGVASIPGPEQALVDYSPPYNRANFAYIDIPGPYEKNLPSIYYIAPPDPAWTPAEQRDYVPGQAVLLFTSVHEVWPGHFLQLPARQPEPVPRWKAVRRLRLRRGVGPLRRRSDVGDGPG